MQCPGIPTASGSFVLCALILIVSAMPAAAQNTTTANTEELISYAYASRDTAFFNISGQSVRAVRLPISIPLRSVKQHPWGVKLRLPISVGFHDFSATGQPGEAPLRESLATITAMAGVEFQVPVGKQWLLKPFVEVGAGKDFGRGAVALIYSGGLYAILDVEHERALFRVGMGAEYDGATLTGGGPSNGFTTLQAGLDVRFPIDRAAGKRPVDWSVFVIRRHFPSALTFDQLSGERIELSNQNELGFTLGTARPFKLWLLKIDRIGVGYRFGDRLSSVRILFNVPF